MVAKTEDERCKITTYHNFPYDISPPQIDAVLIISIVGKVESLCESNSADSSDNVSEEKGWGVGGGGGNQKVDM